MIISGREETTIDYPGKFGQIIFSYGCNFRCGFCQNPDLVKGEKRELDIEDLIKDISTRAKDGWYDAITISGGEPTMYPDLPEFSKRLKGIGLFVKVDSNGTHPEILKKLLIEKSVDYVAMDIKSRKEKYKAIVEAEVDLNKIEESINLVKQFPDYEFRTTVLPFMTSEDMESMGSWVTNKGKEKVKQWTLNQFNAEITLDPEYGKLVPKSKEELESFGKIMEKYAHKVRVLY